MNIIACKACSGTGLVSSGVVCGECHGVGWYRVFEFERMTITPGMPFVPTPIPDIFRPVVSRGLMAQPDSEECE